MRGGGAEEALKASFQGTEPQPLLACSWGRGAHPLSCETLCVHSCHLLLVIAPLHLTLLSWAPGQEMETAGGAMGWQWRGGCRRYAWEEGCGVRRL